MATKQEHVAKADNNAAFALGLDLKSQVNVDWALTALFYSGLHYVEAYFAKIGALPHTHETHGKRTKLIVFDSKLKTVSNEYFELQNFSRQARYDCGTIKATKVTSEAAPALETIKKHIKGIL
jgi:hypothetical protein